MRVNAKEYKNLTLKELDDKFIEACRKGYLEVVEYLLLSPNLKWHAELNADNDSGFNYACSYDRLSIVQFLIFDMNIEKTKNIKDFLKENPNEYVEGMFKIRDLNNNLVQDLIIEKKQSTTDKKMKM